MATMSVGDPDSWLPHKPEFTFPSEFPYDFDSSPDSDTCDDEDDFFAGLTRRLTQQLTFKSPENRVVVGSPESTLNGLGSMSVSSNGSPNGALSPTTTPAPIGAKNDAWDLIYAAAGQVARLKMSQGIPSGSVYSLGHNTPQIQQLRLEQGTPKGQWPSVWERQQQQQQQVKAAAWPKLPPPPSPPQSQISCGGGVYDNSRFVVRPPPLSQAQAQACWPPLQTNRPQYPHNQTAGSLNSGTRAAAGFVGVGYGSTNGGAGAKKECAGTGVFLPRRYGNPVPDSKKQPSPGVIVPAKVVHALNLSFDETATCNGQGQSPGFNASFAADYATLLARRNSILQQQQKRAMQPESGFFSHEIGRLPQEWTY
ncbi:unnamed protein product [Linum trigynum]|uniref:Uncharacterized protein n=1 Tax=Linum trigynum TaxID=586398 RepID=A0AAV2EPE5_9ROSI